MSNELLNIDENFTPISESKMVDNVEWSVDHEKILVEWADKAMCYRWLHARSHVLYSKLNTWYTIPVIIMSTLTGTANFAQERVPLEYRSYFSMIVGGVNLFAGIITTIQQFLKITQLNEAHRVSNIAWDKFYRNIKIELAKHPNERMNVIQMIKINKEEFDRLMETSPIIPDNIISEFKKHFEITSNYNDIFKPEICDTLIPTKDARNDWYCHEDENNAKKFQERIQITQLKDLKNKKLEEYNNNLFNNFITQFKNVNDREPLEEEIIDNLKETLDVELIKNMCEKWKLSKNETGLELVISNN